MATESNRVFDPAKNLSSPYLFGVHVRGAREMLFSSARVSQVIAKRY